MAEAKEGGEKLRSLCPFRITPSQRAEQEGKGGVSLRKIKETFMVSELFKAPHRRLFRPSVRDQDQLDALAGALVLAAILGMLAAALWEIALAVSL